MRTFYEILGVNRGATQEEILVAYRKRCLATHPDRGGNETDFLNVRKGYEILSNPSKRIEYDKWVKAKEDIERKESLSSIKKRLEPWINSFLDQYCKDDFLRTLILTYFYGVDSIYNNIKSSRQNKILTAEIVKNILVIIREDNAHDLEPVLALDYICNDIILGRKDINVSQKAENKPKEKDDIIKEIDKETNNKFSNIAGWFILVLGFGVVWLLCQHDSREIDDLKSKYVEQVQVPQNESVEGTDINKNLSKEEESKDEIEFLYEKFREKGYNVGSYQEFKKALRLKSRADYYYDEGKEKGIITVGRKSFYKIVGCRAKTTTQPAVPSYEETKYQTGDMPYVSFYGSGEKDMNSLSKLEILNYSSTEAVVLLENYYGYIVRHVYIKNNSTYTIKYIPEGLYIMKVMYGNSWNKEKNNGPDYPKGGFMKNVSFSKSKVSDSFDFTFEKTYDGISYPTYSVTLHKVVNGNMQTESIDKDDFF